jgi:hypothetical protein
MQLLVNAWAIPTKIEIQMGEVPKGQERNVKKALFMQVQNSITPHQDPDPDGGGT